MKINFEEEQFNRIFPFYILINPDLVIALNGKTLEKIFPETINTPFFENYRIKRPELSARDFSSLLSLTNQMIVMECLNQNATILRGQFELLPKTGQLLFIGSPWFNSIEQVIANKLNLNDFALHDPLIDLLNVLKTQEITTEDLKNVLITVNKQKLDLKKAAKEIQDIALFPMQNPDPLIRIDSDGNILKENPAAEMFSEFTFEGTDYSKFEFWKKIAKRLNANANREVIDADFGDKTYSFVIKSLPQYGYYNIYGRDITEQKKNVEQIKRLALLASANKNGVLFTDSKGRINYANDGYLKLTRHEIQDILGRTPIEIGRNKLTDEKDILEMRKAFYAGQPFNLEFIHSRKDESWFWCRCQGQPTLNEKDQVINYFAIIEDITLEKESENQLNILSSIAAENTHGVVISNKEGKIEWVNKSFEDMTGYSLEELKNTKPGKYLQGKDTNPDTIDYLRKQIHAGEPFVCEILNYHRTGRPYWLRIQGQALKDRDGNIIKYFAIEEDITREKETQQKLKEFESRFRLALEKIGDNVWEHDFHSNKTVFSNSKNNFIDLVDVESIENDRMWWASVHKDDLHILLENDKKCRKGESDFHILEYRMLLKDGSIKWVLDRGVVIEKNNEGKPLKIIGTHTDITDQKNAEEALKRKEEKYRNIIANINLGLLEVDNEENIQYANQQFCIMSGYQLEELYGKKASDLFIRPESKELIEIKNESRRKSISDAYEVSVSNKMGEHRWWLISGAPNYNDNGELIGSIGIHLDITEQKMLEKELEKALAKAEQATKAQEMFLANMSHEIRTPLNVITGMVRQLNKEDLTEKQREYVKHSETSTSHLLTIVNNILDMSKIQAGEFELYVKDFSVASVATDVISILHSRAKEKKLDLNLYISNDVKPALMGDPGRLRQILINLIGNSIKFTDSGQINLNIKVLSTNNYYQRVLFEVIDTGIGMSEEFMKRLFDKFTQEEASSNRRYEGSGLGMSITKELVQLMGGSIEAKSQKGIGTKIRFELNLPIGDKSKLVVQTIKVNKNSFEGIKILLVEDNEMNRFIAVQSLKITGCEITEAVNGLDAIEKLSENTFDIVLMDIQMPQMNGVEATQFIRKELNKEIPIIALTANAFKNDIDLYLSIGMTDYLIKPYKEEDLYRVVDKYVKKISSKEKLYDIEQILQLSTGDSTFVSKILEVFIKLANETIIQFNKSFKINDLDSIHKAAHKIKPSIDNLKIEKLFEPIRQLEKFNPDELSDSDLKNLIDKVIKVLENVVTEIKSS